MTLHVVIAPDSYKGSIDAAAASSAIARGWSLARPGDRVVECPLADGGEGSLDLLRACHPDALVFHETVTGPDSRQLRAPWLLLGDGTAVVELAVASGLPLMDHPDALLAQTTGFGELLRAARSHPGTRRIVATVGGSAATDGGTGALTALGAQFLDAQGRTLPPGGGSLAALDDVKTADLLPPPPEGIEVLVDVDSPLLGPLGAASRFGPQKGAGPEHVSHLEAGLKALSRLVARDHASVDHDAAGAGAAGGTAYGLNALWGAQIVPGAPRLARLSGLVALLDTADVVVTGEGRLDAQSLRGKVVGHVVELAGNRGVPVLVCPGISDLDDAVGFADVVALVDLAESAEAAMREPATWLTCAASLLANRVSARAEKALTAAPPVGPAHPQTFSASGA